MTHLLGKRKAGHAHVLAAAWQHDTRPVVVDAGLSSGFTVLCSQGAGEYVQIIMQCQCAVAKRPVVKQLLLDV